jgi:hypothetical protein
LIFIFQATDAYCLLEIYKFICNCYSSSDYIKSFRGKKPKKFESTIARQIDENFSDTNNNNINQSTEVIQVGLKKLKKNNIYKI